MNRYGPLVQFSLVLASCAPGPLAQPTVLSVLPTIDHITLINDLTRGFAVLVGTVRDSVSGDPMWRAQVRLTRDSFTPPYYSFTDERGGFVLRPLEPGRYVFSVRKVGYMFWSQPKELSAGHADTVRISIRRAQSLDSEGVVTPATVTAGTTQTDSMPYIRGVIVSDEPGRIGVTSTSGTRIISFPQILIVGDSFPTSPFLVSGKLRPRIWLAFDSTTCIVNERGSTVPADSLKIGQRVIAWVSENLLTSYPPQGGARKIVVENSISGQSVAHEKGRC